MKKFKLLLKILVSTAILLVCISLVLLIIASWLINWIFGLTLTIILLGAISNNILMDMED